MISAFLLLITLFNFNKPSIIEQLVNERTPSNPRPLPGYLLPAKTIGSGRYYNGSSDSVIRNDFLCNDDVDGGCKQQGPAIAVGTDGGLVISWYEFRDGDADIWFQRFDSTGIPIGINERVNTDATLGWQGDPATAIGIDGKFIFSWEDRRDIGNSDVFCQRFDERGYRIGDNFRVNDSAAAGDQSISSVHIAPNGTALVVWDDRRYGLTGDIFAQFLNPDGSLRGGNFRVNDDAIGWANQYEPDVSGDDSGRFIVVWMDGRGNNPSDWNIFCQRFRLDGTPIGNNLRVTSNDSIQWSPRVTAGPAGDFVVCWNDRRRGDWDIYAQIYNSNGEPVGENFRVNTDGGNTQQLLGDVAVNRFNEFIIIWADNRDGDDDIYAQRFDFSGSRIGPEFKINDDTSPTAQNMPTVANHPDGGYWIAWADARSGDFDIFCQRLSRDGSMMGRNFRVNDDSASAHQRVSAIGLERQGNILIAWEDERNTNCDIYATRVDANNLLPNNNIRINDDQVRSYNHYYPCVAGGNNRFLVAWVDGRQGLDIYAQFLDGQGQSVGSNFLVNTGGVSAHQWYPYCTMDSVNRAVIVWMDYRADIFQIYARLYDENRVPVGPEFVVADTFKEGYYASVSMNSAGYFVVAWMDLRDGDINIYCQLFRPDGSRIGKNKRVNTDAGQVYQGYPACAIDDNRNVAIAWEDTRNGSYDVYIQWLDSTGNLIGDNERVNDNPLNQGDCYSPTCAFDNSGRLVVMFNDEREILGNPQIYSQRFNSNRARIGTNQQINERNLFPKNTHWTVGQSVVANESIIGFAWTENRRHLGWDIYAKITDWNLIGITEVSQNPQQFHRAENVCATIINRHKNVEIKDGAGAIVILYDATGRQVCRYPILSNAQMLNIGHLCSGIYFMKFQNSDCKSIKKLLVF